MECHSNSSKCSGYTDYSSASYGIGGDTALEAVQCKILTCPACDIQSMQLQKGGDTFNQLRFKSSQSALVPLGAMQSEQLCQLWGFQELCLCSVLLLGYFLYSLGK